MGVVTTQAPKGLGPQNPTNKLSHWAEFLGQLLSRKDVFKICIPEPHPLKVNCGELANGLERRDILSTRNTHYWVL